MKVWQIYNFIFLVFVMTLTVASCGTQRQQNTAQTSSSGNQQGYIEQLNLVNQSEQSLNQVGVVFYTTSSGLTIVEESPSDPSIQALSATQLTTQRKTRLTSYIQQIETLQSQYLYQNDVGVQGNPPDPQNDPIATKLKLAQELLARI